MPTFLAVHVRKNWLILQLRIKVVIDLIKQVYEYQI